MRWKNFCVNLSTPCPYETPSVKKKPHRISLLFSLFLAASLFGPDSVSPLRIDARAFEIAAGAGGGVSRGFAQVDDGILGEISQIDGSEANQVGRADTTFLEQAGEAESNELKRSAGADTTVLEKTLEATPISPRAEIRALWVTRQDLAGRDSIDRMIDVAVRARFHIIFAQVRGRGDAFYRSALEPLGIELEKPLSEFDPLRYLLDRAHGEGIQVHAWVNVFYVWSDGHAEPPHGHVVHLHPEWLLTDESGRRMDELGIDSLNSLGIEGYFLSPASGEVRKYTVEVIKDIVSAYDVDGIHLDYIRFPGPEYGYSKEDRTSFALRYGVDPLDLIDNRRSIVNLIGEEGAESLDGLFRSWRVQQVDSMVAAVRNALGVLPLSAAVIADPREASRLKAQDWTRWVQKRYVDFVVLMAYNLPPEKLRDVARYLNNAIGVDRYLVGLPLFGGRARYLAPSVSLLRKEGVIGYSLFSYRQLAEHPFSIRFLNSVFLEKEEPDLH
jgi:uncharacterized lipoprotein YddW (UPF0748 family)